MTKLENFFDERFLHTDKEYIWRAYGKMHVILSLGKKQRSRCQLQMIYNKMHFVCHKNLEVKYMACRANDVEEHCILETVK